MPKATNGEAVAQWNRSSSRAGSAEICEKTLAELESEADTTLDKFVAAAESGKEFTRTMQKIEEQLGTARKLEGAERDLAPGARDSGRRPLDLELNEAQVIADKLEAEMPYAEKLAVGAALLESEAEWAGQFESVKDCLETMHSHMKRIKSAGKMHDGNALEARSALISFRKEAAKCRENLASLKERFSSRKHPAHAKVEAARKGLRSVRAGVGVAFSRITKGRLRKKINEARVQIGEFFSGTHQAKMFVDHKHLTLQSGSHKVHLPLTQAVRFALEEIAPIENELSKLGKRGTLITGTYVRDGSGGTLTIGERFVAGDTIIYREKSCRPSF